MTIDSTIDFLRGIKNVYVIQFNTGREDALSQQKKNIIKNLLVKMKVKLTIFN